MHQEDGVHIAALMLWRHIFMCRVHIVLHVLLVALLSEPGPSVCAALSLASRSRLQLQTSRLKVCNIESLLAVLNDVE